MMLLHRKKYIIHYYYTLLYIIFRIPDKGAHVLLECRDIVQQFKGPGVYHIGATSWGGGALIFNFCVKCNAGLVDWFDSIDVGE